MSSDEIQPHQAEEIAALRAAEPAGRGVPLLALDWSLWPGAEQAYAAYVADTSGQGAADWHLTESEHGPAAVLLLELRQDPVRDVPRTSGWRPTIAVAFDATSDDDLAALRGCAQHGRLALTDEATFDELPPDGTHLEPFGRRILIAAVPSDRLASWLRDLGLLNP